VACAAGTTSNVGSSECDDGCDAGSYLVGYDCFYCPTGQVSSCTSSCHTKSALPSTNHQLRCRPSAF
jgi:hypothetical protein